MFVQADQVAPGGTQTIEEARQAEADRNYRVQRDELVRGRIQEVWTASKAECMCFGEPPTGGTSQGDNDQNCPYRVTDEEGGETATVTEKCMNDECSVCSIMNKLDKATLGALGLKRNERLTAMLELAPSIVQSINSGEIPQERRQVLVQAFCDLLSCSRTKLRFVANVGFLTMVCPGLKHLRLHRGWGDVLCNLFKVATAIGYHSDHRSQLAALVFVQQQCIPEHSSPWLWFLQSDDPQEEEAITRELFNQQQQGEVGNSTATT